MNGNLVSAEWVKEHLQDENVRIVDCQFVLGQPAAGRGHYEAGHLPGAVYFDLEQDLSSPKAAHGGRHPLPDAEELANKLGLAGIDESVTVVAYDAQDGAMASRFWWLLNYLGHEKTYVLDGGITLWTAKAYPVTTEVDVPLQRTFVPHVQADMVLHIEDVKARLGQEGVVLVDSREAKRYQGLEEAIDPVAGHIPGATNQFWKEGLTETGAWKTADEQAKRFASLRDAKEVIVYCGSGVTACPNILALKEAGVDNVKLYAGSWSDWVSYAENPVETTKEEG